MKIADDLANTLNTKGTALLSFTTPEVKGRLIHQMLRGNFMKWEKWYPEFDDDKNKEKAILLVLSTVASRKEYRKILENMDSEKLPPRSTQNPWRSRRRATQATRRARNEKRLRDFMDGDMVTRFDEWLKTLPEVANPIGK